MRYTAEFAVADQGVVYRVAPEADQVIPLVAEFDCAWPAVTTKVNAANQLLGLVWPKCGVASTLLPKTIACT
jgi:hypothetical protein